MSQREQQNYIPALTGVRAMAAYLVFISHYEGTFDTNFPHYLKRFLLEFHIGVTIFFVLSGFLIAFRYYGNFHLTKDWFLQYLKNRVARIYPMYFLLTTGVFIYYYFSRDPAVTNGFPNATGLFFMNITFVRGFFNQLKFTGIAQGWSLTVEECFYFSAPIIFLVISKYRKFFLQIVAITGLGFLLVLIFRNIDWYGFFSNFTFMMLYTFLGRCFEFFVGIKLALMVRKNGIARKNKLKFTYIGFFGIFFCVWILSRLPIPAGWFVGLQNPFGIIANNYLLPIAIATFFYGLITETTKMKMVLANPFVELLGKSSYIFYLIHLGYMYIYISRGINWLNDRVFNLYDKWNVDWHSPFEYDWLNIIYAFILLNGLSILLFKCIEEPLNHYIRKSDFLIKAKPKQMSHVG
ncbi:MAG TPA: acyltransferase [Mucilaginibacter sp.]|nr:acyltransferase [Mucilaginibacter sp.]